MQFYLSYREIDCGLQLGSAVIAEESSNISSIKIKSIPDRVGSFSYILTKFNMRLCKFRLWFSGVLIIDNKPQYHYKLLYAFEYIC